MILNNTVYNMGCSFFSTCSTDCTGAAPNPSPSRWSLLRLQQFPSAHVVEVKYLDCTNFEGIKIMVYSGEWQECDTLDPHFAETGRSPIARFKPTPEGWLMAVEFAKNYERTNAGCRST